MARQERQRQLACASAVFRATLKGLHGKDTKRLDETIEEERARLESERQRSHAERQRTVALQNAQLRRRLASVTTGKDVKELDDAVLQRRKDLCERRKLAEQQRRGAVLQDSRRLQLMRQTAMPRIDPSVGTVVTSEK
jgi:hypothetical protein